jgi:hypothetical protein
VFSENLLKSTFFKNKLLLNLDKYKVKGVDFLFSDTYRLLTSTALQVGWLQIKMTWGSTQCGHTEEVSLIRSWYQFIDLGGMNSLVGWGTCEFYSCRRIL